MFLAFRQAGAKDWKSNLTIALDHSGAQHRLQFHHIFPKAYLKQMYRGREADDIANLAFIGGKTNRNISAKPPAEYLQDIVAKNGSAPLETQRIPIDPNLLTIENYKLFLAKRREMIADALNQFLGGSTAA